MRIKNGEDVRDEGTQTIQERNWATKESKHARKEMKPARKGNMWAVTKGSKTGKKEIGRKDGGQMRKESRHAMNEGKQTRTESK